MSSGENVRLRARCTAPTSRATGAWWSACSTNTEVLTFEASKMRRAEVYFGWTL